MLAMSNPYVISVLKSELAKLDKRLGLVVAKCKSNPAIELLELMEETSKKIESGMDRLSPEFMAWISGAAKKEKALKKQMKAQTGSAGKSLWDERLKLEGNISDVAHAISIYRIRTNH
jgi:hypothetical protein